jgi:hypothetical protein
VTLPKEVWEKLWNIGLSLTIRFDGPDAGMDKCVQCTEQRRTHGKRTHRFVEKEKENAKQD